MYLEQSPFQGLRRAAPQKPKMWPGDPDGDMTVSFEGFVWQVKEHIMTTHFPWMHTAFPHRRPVCSLDIYPPHSQTDMT